MSGKRVQKDIDALNADLLNCETIVSRVLLNNKARTVNQVAQKSRTKSVGQKSTATARGDRTVAPMVTGPPTKLRSSTSSHQEPRPMGQHCFHRELDGDTVVEVIVKSKSSSETNRKRSSSTQLLRTDSQSNSEEAAKQTNLNYNTKLQSKPSNPSNENLTWDQRLRQSMPNSQVAPKNNPPNLNWDLKLKQSSSQTSQDAPARRVIISKSRTNMPQHTDCQHCDTTNQRSRHVGDINLVEGRNSGASMASTSAATHGEGIYVEYQQPVASTQGHRSESNMNPGRSMQSLRHVSPAASDHQHLDLMQQLNAKITELNKKLEIYGLSKSNADMLPLMKDIEHMTKQLPSDTDETQLLPINVSHFIRPGVHGDKPVRDTDHIKVTGKREATGKSVQPHSHGQNGSSPRKVKPHHGPRSPPRVKPLPASASSPVKNAANPLDNAMQTITALKLNLENMTQKAHDYSKSIETLTRLTEELRDENTIIPKLRATQAKLNERIELMMRENMKLTTDIQLVTNEKEKLASEIFAKDTELLQLREEIKDIQLFVTDQLEVLKPESAPKFTMEQLDGVLNSLQSRDQESDLSGLCLEEGVVLPVTSSPSSDVESNGIGASWQDISHISRPPGNVAYVRSSSPSTPDSLVPIVNARLPDSPLNDSAEQVFTELPSSPANLGPASQRSETTPRVQHTAKKITEGFTDMMTDIRLQLANDFKMPKLPESNPPSSDSSFNMQLSGQSDFFKRLVD